MADPASKRELDQILSKNGNNVRNIGCMISDGVLRIFFADVETANVFAALLRLQGPQPAVGLFKPRHFLLFGMLWCVFSMRMH